MDAPESDQLCRGDDSELYRCGQKAAAALAGLFYAIPRPVICAPKDRDQYGRTVAVCKIGDPGPNIAHWMVTNGHALDWPRYSRGEYAAAQRRAEGASAGMWAGSFSRAMAISVVYPGRRKAFRVFGQGTRPMIRL
ncbi:thermonuclease family protein [Bradyrhizobium niftali]|uniref:thermonuclease family protein n=1 Tax=Bradyrhizobium niftali TaxID=2560055 RepID=UPI00385005E6